MKKSEKFVAPNQAQQDLGARWDPNDHGTDGPLEIAFSQIRDTEQQKQKRSWKGEGGATQKWRRMYTGPQQAAFIQAVGETLGVQPVDDQCSGQANSVAYTPNSIGVDGRRTSSASAYYTPVENRENLTILTGPERRTSFGPTTMAAPTADCGAPALSYNNRMMEIRSPSMRARKSSLPLAHSTPHPPTTFWCWCQSRPLRYWR